MTDSLLKNYYTHCRQFLIPGFLFVVTIVVYGICGSFELLNSWDDDLYITMNSAIQHFSPDNLKQIFTGYFVGNYAPLHMFSYMVDYALWGAAPAGYHLENVLLHAINGSLFYLLVLRLHASPKIAAAAAWIFLFHPVQVETVAWVSERKNLLALLFLLLALHAYHEYCQRQEKRLFPYLSSVGAILLASLSKPVVVVFPLVIMLYDVTCRTADARAVRKPSGEKVPFLAVAGATAVLTMISQTAEHGGGRVGYPGGTPSATFFTMVPVLVGYLQDCVLPFNLSPFYVVPVRSQPDSTFFGALALLLVIAGCGGYLVQKARRQLFWFGLFFIALIPVLQIVPLNTLKHDRYLYCALPGFAGVMAYGILCLEKLPATTRRILTVVSLCAMLTLPYLAYHQALYWRNDVTLWQRAIAVDPENRVAWRFLALSYTHTRDRAAAFQAFKRLDELNSRLAPLHGTR